MMTLTLVHLHLNCVGYRLVVVTGVATFNDIGGGAVDGVTIGVASAGAATFTDFTATGTTTVTTVDINGGRILVVQVQVHLLIS